MRVRLFQGRTVFSSKRFMSQNSFSLVWHRPVATPILVSMVSFSLPLFSSHRPKRFHKNSAATQLKLRTAQCSAVLFYPLFYRSKVLKEILLLFFLFLFLAWNQVKKMLQMEQKMFANKICSKTNKTFSNENKKCLRTKFVQNWTKKVTKGTKNVRKESHKIQMAL